MRHIFRTRRRTVIQRRGRELASPRIAHQTSRTAHRARHTAHHAPARGLSEPQRNNRTLPNNVARNSPRSFFNYVSKRCNSNTANSKFEIVSRELRAKFIEGPAVEEHEDYSSDRPDQHHTPQIDQTSTTHRAPRARARTARAGPYRIMSHVIPHGHFSTTPQNVAIPTLRIQSLK